jgi:hypothetical protein
VREVSGQTSVSLKGPVDECLWCCELEAVEFLVLKKCEK